MFLIIIIVINNQLCFFVKKKKVVSLPVTHSFSKGRKRAVPSVGCSTEAFRNSDLVLKYQVPILGHHLLKSAQPVGWDGRGSFH